MNEKRSNYSNEKIIAVYEAQNGHMTNTAKALGIDRHTLQEWRDADPSLTAAMASVDEEMIDEAESALKQLIRSGNPTAIIFALKTKGRRRGYVERTEVTGADGAPIAPIAIEVIDSREQVRDATDTND